MARILSGWKARRYAIALLQVAAKANELDRVEAEVKALADTLNRSPLLVKFLAQPLIPFGEKARQVRQWFENRISPITLNFLLSVIKHKRIEHFDHIARIFTELVREHRNETVAEITTAVPLTEEERALTVQRLQEVTGKKVLLSEKVDPSILGGMRIVVGDKLLDLSLKGHLERIRERLRQVFIATPEEVTIAEATFSDPKGDGGGEKDGAP
ncbi:MAG: ATP synthase F1 subunit delta [Armatimonadetes bacterium]|nr:ATP synthase F1 subunit delta [Armatimonadota bacterium]